MFKEKLKLSDLQVGSKLLYRAKSDWRTVAIARIGEEKVTLTVCSPTGRTYRLSRALGLEIYFDKDIPVLPSDYSDKWTENLTSYDRRW